jgi:hypothetical protein
MNNQKYDNQCARCEETDDPQDTKHWSEDNDGDKICPRCSREMAWREVDQVILAAVRYEPAPPATFPLEHPKLRSLSEVEAELAARKAQTPIDRIERRDAA